MNHILYQTGLEVPLFCKSDHIKSGAEKAPENGCFKVLMNLSFYNCTGWLVMGRTMFEVRCSIVGRQK